MRKIISVLLSAALAVSVFTFNPPSIRADNEADYEEVLTVGSSSTHLSLPPLVDGFKDGHYEIGDVIDITLQTGYTFQTEEYTMTVSDPSIVSAALLDETTLRVTCVGNGLARILVRHSLPSASGRTANIGILVGYNYPKTLLTLPLAESVGLMPEIPSSASRYHVYNKISDGIAVDGANAGVRTVSGLNDQYVIQRFDQSYLINDVQVFMSDDSSFAKPTHFSIELCDAAFPVGYAKNDKLGTQAPYAGRGDFTDYYSFDGAGTTHFGGGNGTILPDFDAQIQAWPWTKIYEGAFEDYPGYIAKVEKAQILGYMAENGITGGRTGYFIKVNVHIEGEMPGNQGFMFQQIAINAFPKSTSNIPAFNQNNPNQEIFADIDADISYTVFSNEMAPAASLSYRVWNEKSNAYGEVKTVNAQAAAIDIPPEDLPGVYGNKHQVSAVIPGEDLQGGMVQYWITFAGYESGKTERDDIKTIHSISVTRESAEVPQNSQEPFILSAVTENGEYNRDPSVKWEETDAAGEALQSGHKLDLIQSPESTVGIKVKKDVEVNLNTYKASGYGEITYISAFAAGKRSAPVPVYILPGVITAEMNMLVSPTSLTLLNNASIQAARSMDIAINLTADGERKTGVYKDQITEDTLNHYFVADSVEYEITNDPDNLLEVIADSTDPFAAVIQVKDTAPSGATVYGAVVTAAVTDILGNRKPAACDVDVIDNISSEELASITVTRVSERIPETLYNGDGEYTTLEVKAEGIIKNVKFELSEEDKGEFELYEMIGPDINGMVSIKVKAIGKKPKAEAVISASSILPGSDARTEFTVSYETKPKLAIYEYGASEVASSSTIRAGTGKVMAVRIYPSCEDDPLAAYDEQLFSSELGVQWFELEAKEAESFTVEELPATRQGYKYYYIEGISAGTGAFEVSSGFFEHSTASASITTEPAEVVLEDVLFPNPQVVLNLDEQIDLSDEIQAVPSEADKSGIVLDSGDTSVVQVVSGATIKAVGVGQATITARINGTDIKAPLKAVVLKERQNIALKAAITDTAAVKISRISSSDITELNNNNPADTTEANKYLTGLNGSLVFDFGPGASEYTDEIIINWFAKDQIIMPESFHVMTSLDGENWEMLYETEHATKDAPKFQDSSSNRNIPSTYTGFNAVSRFRYLKFTFTEFSGQSTFPTAIGIREIQIIDAGFKKPLTISLDDGTSRVRLGESKVVSALYDGQPQAQLYYSSQNPDIAIVDSDGLVTGIRNGTAFIIARMPDGTASQPMEITVTNGVSKVVIQDENEALAVDAVSSKLYLSLEGGLNKRKLKVNIVPQNAVVNEILWSAEQGGVTVTQEGVVTADTAGGGVVKATVIYEQEGYTESAYALCDVTVVSERVAVTDISLSPTSINLYAGTQSYLKAALGGEGGAVPTNSRVIWFSENSNVATVNQKGVVTAAGVGQTKIYALSEDGLKCGESIVTVRGVSIQAAFAEDYDSVYLRSGNKAINTSANKWVVYAYALADDSSVLEDMKLKQSMVNGVDYQCDLPAGLNVSAAVSQDTQSIAFTVSGELENPQSGTLSVPIRINKSAIPGAAGDAHLTGYIRPMKNYTLTYENTEDNSVAMESAKAVKSTDKSYKIKVKALTEEGNDFTGFKIKSGAYTSVNYRVKTPDTGLTVSSVAGNSADNTVTVTLTGSSVTNITQDTNFGIDLELNILADYPKNISFTYTSPADLAVVKAYTSAGNGGGGNPGGIIGGGPPSGSGADTPQTPQSLETGTLTYQFFGSEKIWITPKKERLEQLIENSDSDTFILRVDLEPKANDIVLEMETSTYQKLIDSNCNLELAAQGITVTLNPKDISPFADSGFIINIRKEADSTYSVRLLDASQRAIAENAAVPLHIKITYDSEKIKDYEKLIVESERKEGSSWSVIPSKASANGHVQATMNGFGKVRLAYGTVEFQDVAAHWAEKEIHVLAARKVVNGVTAEEFNPQANVTRAEFAAMLVRALYGEPAEAENRFSDITNGDWYANAVNAAAHMGIVTGFDGVFAPNSYLTREEMTVMIVRVIESVDSGAELKSASLPFADNGQINDWARKSVEIAVGLGLVKGIDDELFAPAGHTTRAQTAVVIYRLLGYLQYL